MSDWEELLAKATDFLDRFDLETTIVIVFFCAFLVSVFFGRGGSDSNDRRSYAGHLVIVAIAGAIGYATLIR